MAQEATDLSIATSTNNSTFTLTKGSIVQNVSNVDISGYEAVTFAQGSNVGAEVETLNINASELYSDFEGFFEGTGAQPQTLTFTGSLTGSNYVNAAGNYGTISFTGGNGTDTLDLRGLTVTPNTTISADMGSGKNLIYVDAGNQAWLEQQITKGNITGVTNDDVNPPFTGGELNGATTYVPPSTTPVQVSDPNAPVIDLSGVKYENPTQQVNIDATNGQKIILGETTGMQNPTSVAASPNTVIDAAGLNDVSVELTAADSVVGIITNDSNDRNPSSTITSLDLANTSGGDVVIAAGNTGSLFSGSYNTALNGVSSVNVNTGNEADATTTLFGLPVGSGGTTYTNVLMENVHSVKLNGEGNAVVQAQLGNTSNSGIDFDATGIGNVTTEALFSKVINYKGASGADILNTAVTGTSSNTASIFTLGNGTDVMALNLNTAGFGTTGTAAFSKININLADTDNAQDTIILYGSGGSTNLAGTNSGHGALISISGFDNLEDRICFKSSLISNELGSAVTSDAGDDLTVATSPNWNVINSIYGINASGSGQIAYSSDSQTSYLVLQGEGKTLPTDASADNVGIYVLELVGVHLESVSGLNFDAQLTA